MFEPNEESKYNVILGRDILQELGIDIINSKKCFHWAGVKVPMVPRRFWSKSKITKFWIQEKNSALDKYHELAAFHQIQETYAMNKILAAKYEPINLTKVVNSQEHLTIPERLALSKVFQNHLRLF